MAEEKRELTPEELSKVSGGTINEDEYKKFKPMFDAYAKNAKDENVFAVMIKGRGYGWSKEDLIEIYRTYYA